MAARKLRIVFFTPNFNRNGAETMLWYLLNNIDREKVEFKVCCLNKGLLLRENTPSFETENLINHSPVYNFFDKSFRRIFKKSLFEKKIERINREYKPDLWYFNTINMTDFIPFLERNKIPFIVHWHEMTSFLENFTVNEIKFIVEKPVVSIACSESVRETIKKLGGEKVEVQYESIDFKKIKTDSARSAVLRKSLNIPENMFLWVMSGYCSYRKGLDFLPVLAELIAPYNGGILWIGGEKRGLHYYVRKELEKKKIKNVFFSGEQTNEYYNYLDTANGYVLLSREDPFPLTMIEAAALGKPIVSSNSGGVSEFVKEGMGLVIESKNLVDLSLAMRKVMAGEINVIPQNSVNRAKEFDIKNQVNNWEKLLLPIINHTLK